jgi:hypothetical protein
MSNPLTLPIARLRAHGCKVSTILGHDPQIGSFQYRVTYPATATIPPQRTLGHAHLRNYRSENRSFVYASVYRVGQPIQPREVREAAGNDVALVLTEIANRLEGA